MLNIQKHMCVVESKGEFSASKILSQISSREGFRIKDYFQPKSKSSQTSPLLIKTKIAPLKLSKKEFYGYWEIKDSMKYKSQFRLRKREVIEKLKLKSNIFKPMNYNLSTAIQLKIAKSQNIKFRK